MTSLARFPVWIAAVCLIGLGSTLTAYGAQAPAPSRPARKALVIGISMYQAPMPPLPTAARNASLIADGLRSLGFFVQSTPGDLDNPGLKQSIESFAKTLQPGDCALVYFSGQAVQDDSDRNWLLPADFVPGARDLPLSAFSLNRLITALEETQASPRIVILDSSFLNPELDKLLHPGQPKDGLAVIDSSELATGTEVMMSAEPNRHSTPKTSALFADSLVKAWKEPGSSLSAVFERLRLVFLDRVLNQAPWRQPKVVKEFYFVDPEIDTVLPTSGTGPQTGVPRTARTDGMDYMWIPPGKFKMGCVPGDSKCEKPEQPQHEVAMEKGFWITRTEVTAQSYGRFARTTGRPLPPPTMFNPKMELKGVPQTAVSQQDAADYCKWAGGRLPTEAEWEYAARGGKADSIYPWGNTMEKDTANGFGKYDSYAELAPVRSFPQAVNGFGLYDVSGNVWEWTSEPFNPVAYEGKPAPPTKKPLITIRGGGFHDNPERLRLSFRGSSTPEPSSQVGFRCVLESTFDKF